MNYERYIIIINVAIINTVIHGMRYLRLNYNHNLIAEDAYREFFDSCA